MIRAMEKRGRGRPRREGADEEILSAALALLRERSYRDFSVDEIASRTGVAKTTIYRRWPSKGALVAATVEPLATADLEDSDTGTLRGDLSLLLRRFAETVSGELGPVVAALIGESQTDKELQEILRRALTPRRKLFHDALDRAVARGELSAATDRELFVDMLRGPIWTRLLLTGGKIDHDVADSIVAMMTRK
jgi:AcrR family transcriptional regulator